MGLDGREGQSSHSLEERLPLQTETLLWFHAGSELKLPIWDQLGSRDVAVMPREGWWHWRLPCAIFVGCDCDGILGISVQHPLSQDSAEWSPSVMFTHPALKSLLTSLTTWKQDTGGFYLVWVLGTVEQVGKERANDSTSVPASLVSRLVLEQFLLPTTAPWMQIMNVNPASLFQGQTPQKKGVSQGAGVVNRVCLLCALGWVLPPFFPFFLRHFQRVRENRTPAGLTPPPEVRTFVLYLLLCNIVLLSVMKRRGRGGRTGCQYDCDIWMIYLIPLLSNLTLTLSVNSEPCLRCSCW